MTGTLFGLGVGPGDPELLTLKALRLLRASPVVAYPAPETGDSFARSIVADHLCNGVIEVPIRIPIAGGAFPDETIYDRAAKTLSEHLAAGRDIAVLCEGDPFFYGSFMYLFGRLAATHKVEVVPGVSSLMACAAVLGAPLSARNDTLAVLPAPLPAKVLRERLRDAEAAAIIKVGRHFEKVRGVLNELGLTDCAHYVERATLENQRIVAIEAVDPATVPYFSLILVHRRGSAWRP
ncbi:MAG: precorrin-2 C(20)-methyltransferase [Alphaproteobacteria bacterium]|nr:precorrin-2 C(20)-methyltransferase [Alphaproteobacteria bacterium]